MALESSSRTVTSLPDLLASLSALQSREAALSTTLDQLLSNKQTLAASIDRIQSLASYVDELHQESSVLVQNVSVTANTAERVGGKVRILDEEMRRVKDAAERVNLIMELKASLGSLQQAMDSQDWESATRHCARAMSVPTEVISGGFAENAIPTAESSLPPVQTLQSARETLLTIFREQFQSASQVRDATATSRFFKLFPVIGWEKEGLEEYSTFVVDLVRSRSPASAKTTSPMYYIAMLTSLFEGIALIVDQHQPIVEKYYGPGKMTFVVSRLVEEGDRVVTKLADGWVEERSVKRKLAQTNNSSFTFLGNAPRRQAAQPNTEDEIDLREIDKLLFELTGMASRWGLFRRFLCDRLGEERGSEGSTDEHIPSPLKQTRDVFGTLSLLESSGSHKIFDNLLKEYYSPLEVWYLRVIIDKAHRLSSVDSMTGPLLTTTPDDVFYILRSVLNRLLSTSSHSAIQHVTIEIREVMNKDYAAVIKRRLEDVYKNTNVSQSGSSREKAEKENRTKFITFVNDLDLSSSHMDRLVKDILSSSTISQNFLDDESGNVKAYISGLLELIPRFQSIQKGGVEQLFNQLARPRLRPLVADMYKDVTYVLDEEAYTASDSLDVVRKRFIRIWESVMEGFKDAFTENNYGVFFGQAVDMFVRLWEKMVLGMRFTELGAVRFDRDVRAILTYLSSQTAFGTAREKFQRLQQISTLLNLDIEEDGNEFYNNSGINWRLNLSEATAIVSLRV